MSRLDLASLREGDVIESTQTLQVTYTKDGYVEAKDVQSGNCFGFLSGDVDGSHSTRKLVMVKRAVRKPKVGDVITGEEMKAAQWKQGSTFHSKDPSCVYMLHHDGRWRCSKFMGSFTFSDFTDSEKLTVLHVA